MTAAKIAEETGHNVLTVRRKLFSRQQAGSPIGRTIGNDYFWVISRPEYEIEWQGRPPTKAIKAKIEEWNTMPLWTTAELAKETKCLERRLRRIAARMDAKDRPHWLEFGDGKGMWLIDKNHRAALLKSAKETENMPTPTRKLTPAQVKYIRKSSKSLGELAKRYKVAPSTISRVKAGETY